MENLNLVMSLIALTDEKKIEERKADMAKLNSMEAFEVLKSSSIAHAFVPYFAHTYETLNRYAVAHLLNNELICEKIVPYFEKRLISFDKSTVSDILGCSPIADKIVPIVKEQLKEFSKEDVMQFVAPSPIADRLIPMFDCLKDLSDEDIATIFKRNQKIENLIPLFEQRLKAVEPSMTYSILMCARSPQKLLDVFSEQLSTYDTEMILSLLKNIFGGARKKLFSYFKDVLSQADGNVIKEVLTVVSIDADVLDIFKNRLDGLETKQLITILKKCNSPNEIMKHVSPSRFDKDDVLLILFYSKHGDELVTPFKKQILEFDEHDFRALLIASPVGDKLRPIFIGMELI
jgi:hypothetical protein